MNDIKIIDNFLDGREFRNYVDRLLMKKGYANVSIDDPRLTDKSKKNDNDLLAEKDGIKYTVQTFLNISITEKEIKEAINDIKKEKADRAIIITNRDADKTVKKNASEKNVDIWAHTPKFGINWLWVQPGQVGGFESFLVNASGKTEVKNHCPVLCCVL